MDILAWTEDGTRIVVVPSGASPLVGTLVNPPGRHLARVYWDCGHDNLHIADVWWDGVNVPEIKVGQADHSYPPDCGVDDAILRVVRDDLLDEFTDSGDEA